MKILMLSLLIPFRLLGQVTADEVSVVFESPDEWKSYKSKEEDSYYERNRYQEFTPQAIDLVKEHRLKHIKILSSEDKTRKSMRPPFKR